MSFAIVIDDADGEVLGAVAMARDATERWYPRGVERNPSSGRVTVGIDTRPAL